MRAAEKPELIAHGSLYRDSSVQAAFICQARKNPLAIALRTRERTLSYAELDSLSGACAAALREHGAGPGQRVGMLLPRCAEAIVAMLGILKTGAAFVSFDDAYPSTALAAMARECEPVAMVVDQKHPTCASHAMPFWTSPVVDLGLLMDRPQTGSCDELAPDDPEAPAYVMYTSGSTGQPKGVVVPHRGILRLVIDTDYVALGPDEVILQLAPLGFDACIFEIFAALLNGWTLAIDTTQPVSLDSIADAIASFRVTTLWLTAGLFHLMVDQRPLALRGLRQLLAGGDALSPAHVRQMLRLAPSCRLINGYGPTENTVFTCCYSFPCDWNGQNGAPVGSPIKGSVVHILDDDLRPVADGEAGELCASGQGVALGYLNRAEQTARSFVPDPFSATEALLYRTGDLVRRRPDGIIEFVGRLDRQIKISGKRIELEGIETALRSAPAVRDCVAVLHGEGEAIGIVAFAVAERQPGLEDELGRYLAALLPAWMCPSRILVLEALPLTSNGKVDRQTLLKMALVRTVGEVPHAGLEQDLARICAKVLQLSEIDRSFNFADLGATSLQMMALQGALVRELNRDIPILELFAYPTIAALAAFMNGLPDGTARAEVRERAERQSEALRRLAHRMKSPMKLHSLRSSA